VDFLALFLTMTLHLRTKTLEDLRRKMTKSLGLDRLRKKRKKKKEDYLKK